MPRLGMLKHIRANLSSREYARIRLLVSGVQLLYTIIFLIWALGTRYLWTPVLRILLLYGSYTSEVICETTEVTVQLPATGTNLYCKSCEEEEYLTGICTPFILTF
jgi:hypothetical protein